MELPSLEKYKSEIHQTLISKLDLEKLSRHQFQPGTAGSCRHHQGDY